MSYLGRFFNRLCAYVSGDYMDVSIFPVFQRAGVRRGKCRPTSEIQAKLNLRNSMRALLRIIRANFDLNSFFVTDTYAVEPGTLEEAMRDRHNRLRRLKRLYRRYGKELKYIVCTERGKTSGRWHHHYILSGGVPRDEIEACWGKGYSNSKRLQLGDDGLEKLTRYMSKSRETFKRWSGSRNLTRVEPIERDGALSMDEVAELGEAIQDGTAMELIERMFPGYELVRDPEAEPNVINHYWYIQIELRKKKPVPKWGRSRREKKLE